MILVLFFVGLVVILTGSLAGLAVAAVVYKRWLAVGLGSTAFVLGGIASGLVGFSGVEAHHKTATAFLILALAGSAGGLLAGIAIPVLGLRKRGENQSNVGRQMRQP
jgi:hypothetical protein